MSTNKIEKTQQDYLHEAKRAVNQGNADYAERVIYAWHARMDLDPPFRVNQHEDTQTDFCADCSTGPEPTEAVFFWTRWSSLCGPCSLARFDSDGQNPRIADQAERRGGR